MTNNIKLMLDHFDFKLEMSSTIWGLGIISKSHYPMKSGKIIIHFLPWILTIYVCTKKDK